MIMKQELGAILHPFSYNTLWNSLDILGMLMRWENTNVCAPHKEAFEFDYEIYTAVPTMNTLRFAYCFRLFFFFVVDYL